MGTVKKLLRNRTFLFILAIFGGLAAPHAAQFTHFLVLPALAVAMTLSVLEIGSDKVRGVRSFMFPAMIGILMNYIILGNVLVGLSALLITDNDLWTGFVLLAAVPPAVAVIPFSAILKGNVTLSLFGTVGAYVGGLGIMPLIAAGLLGASSFPFHKLVITAFLLVLIPIVLSRLLVHFGWHKVIGPYRGPVTNWSFFAVLYTMIALNQKVITGGSASVLIPIAVILVTGTFILGLVIEWICGAFHIPNDTKTSLVLLGTLKNQATAGGLALTFFNQDAALPAAISSVIMILYVLWLDVKDRWYERMITVLQRTWNASR